MQHKKPSAIPPIKVEVSSFPSDQLLWFLASITSTRDSNPDLPAPRPVALPVGHCVGRETEYRAVELVSRVCVKNLFFTNL